MCIRDSYVYAYSKLFAQGAVAKDEKINIVVPTGKDVYKRQGQN